MFLLLKQKYKNKNGLILKKGTYTILGKKSKIDLLRGLIRMYNFGLSVH